MISDALSLSDILDINNFQSMQDNLSKSTNTALLTVDYKGIPVTTHSECQRYCEKVREIPSLLDLCHKCDSRGGLEAARLQKPYIYVCHMGIVDLAVPIIVDDQYLGAMMAGQVRIDDDSKLEYILNRKNDLNDDVTLKAIEDLKTLYSDLPVMSFEKIEAIGNVLFGLSEVLVDRARLIKNADTNTQSFNSKVPIQNEPLVESKIPTQYIFLKPAIEFMHLHIHEKVSLDDMATLCNISNSYFSKSFNKALNMNFSTYQNNLKISVAEEYLKNTNKNINQIADEMGFDNVSYFIKVFKKVLGVTPAMYKHLYVKKTLVEYENKYNQI